MATRSAGGPNVPQTEANPSGSGLVPFRRATTFRTSTLATTTETMTTSQQSVEENIEGSGYIYAVDLDVTCTTAGNAANTTYDEDAPYSALASVIFKDTNGELINLSGYSLHIANRYFGFAKFDAETSTDTSIYALTSGAGATGGSFRFHLYVPVGVNRRGLIGILGNQDRAQKYSLRTDLAASGDVYGTAPTTLGTVTIARTYENYAVPAAQNGLGAQQQQEPPKHGVLHYITQTVNPGSAPLGGSTINHYLPRLGNTIRAIALIFRSNSSRATAESNLPSRISFKLGDTVIFTETPAYRRRVMFDRYGFDAPDGVLVYDWITDVVGHAGDENGEDYAFTVGLVNAQFEITYPSGMGSTANTLTVITDDLQIPENVDIYAE